MRFRKILENIFSVEELKSEPPVLIDIGASGNIHKKWKKIAKYSICVAFDADTREMEYIEKADADFKKLYVFNCIVSDQDIEKTDFHLTKSPYCSSILEPDLEKLKIWAYAEKFEVVGKEQINVKSLAKILTELKLDRIDWFKSDSQGVDLRIFKSLSESVRNKIIAAELEPGFIDSYKGEDKLSQIISSFERENFWISDITIKGSQRITKEQLNNFSGVPFMRKLAQFSHKTSPGWAEIIYLNNFEDEFSLRDYMLGWIFTIILNQYGFSHTLAEKAIAKYRDSDYADLLNEMRSYSLKKIRRDIYRLKFFPAAVEKISKMLGSQ